MAAERTESSLYVGNKMLQTFFIFYLSVQEFRMGMNQYLTKFQEKNAATGTSRRYIVHLTLCYHGFDATTQTYLPFSLPLSSLWHSCKLSTLFCRGSMGISRAGQREANCCCHEHLDQTDGFSLNICGVRAGTSAV